MKDRVFDFVPNLGPGDLAMNCTIASAQTSQQVHTDCPSLALRAARAVFIAASIMSGVTALGQTKSSAPPHAEFKAAIAQAKVELKKEEHAAEGALVYRIRSRDGKLALARTALHNTTPGYGGHRPGKAAEGETVTAFGRNHRMFDLRINAPGYHELVRSGVFRKGKVVAWDDLELEPVTAATAGTIDCIVQLEGGADAGGVRLIAHGYPQAVTDTLGRFRFTGLGAGSLLISASKKGYIADYDTVEVSRGGVTACELMIYRQRSAQVRWAYQPKESRDLIGGVTTGSGLVSPKGLGRVSFAKGFVQVTGKSDFFVHQDEDKLIIKNFDASFQGPGMMELHGVPFDKVKEAPQADYGTTPITMREGGVYVLRTYDGKHYAKMEVTGLFDGISTGEAVSLSLPSRCHIAKPLPKDGVLPSVAVLDLDTSGNVPDGVARALSDLTRSVVQETGRYILVDRDSIIHILGEQDFISTIKCDNTRCLVNYGKKLRAQKILHGRVSQIGKTFVLSLKLIDVATAAVDAFHTNRTTDGVDGLLEFIEPQTCELIRSAAAKKP